MILYLSYPLLAYEQLIQCCGMMIWMKKAQQVTRSQVLKNSTIQPDLLATLSACEKEASGPVTGKANILQDHHYNIHECFAVLVILSPCALFKMLCFV